MLSSKTTKVESLHKVTTAIVDCHQMRSTIYVGRPRNLEICRIEFTNLRLIEVCKEGCSLIHRVQNGGRTTAYLKLGRGSGKWTYQESIKHDMRNRDLRRINSQGKNDEGDKGKETH